MLVLSPTRELAQQIQKIVLALGDYMNVQCHACIGGTSIGEDIRKLDHGVHVVSGTPGRVFDMIKRRNLRTRALKLVCWLSVRIYTINIHMDDYACSCVAEGSFGRCQTLELSRAARVIAMQYICPFTHTYVVLLT